MDRGRPINKTILPTHINLNLQALPATNIPEQLRKQKRLSQVDQQYVNRIIVPSKTRFPSRSRDSSRNRDSSKSRRSQKDRYDRWDDEVKSHSSLTELTHEQNIRDVAHLLGNNRAGYLTGVEPAMYSPTHSSTIVRPSTAGRNKISPYISERLDLDSRNLEKVPDLSGGYSEVLKLLNLQHNIISSLAGIQVVKRLVFLDLYDNKVSDISPLCGLYCLRVLMLGKNNIKKVTGLHQMDKLDVLDIHANLITDTDGLENLQNLRTLNMAGNLIKKIDKFHHLHSLTELNLRRNNIEKVENLQCLDYLKRLFLSFNSISRWEDIWSISECPDLNELTLDGNPLCSGANYRQAVIASSSKFKILDGKRISEEERRTASTNLRKEIEKRKSEEKAQIRAERRKLAISNAARLWRSELVNDDDSGTASPDFGIYTGQVNVLDSGDSHLIELSPDNNTVRLYGTDSIQYIEKAVGNSLASSINGLFLRYGAGKCLIDRIGRIKSRLPNLHSLSFGECGLSKLVHFDRLHELTGLTHIHVESCNTVTKIQFWREYLIQKATNIQFINGSQILGREIKRATTLFGNYFDAQCQLPTYRHDLNVSDQEADSDRFSVLLTECQQLEKRRQRIKSVAPQVWLSILRDVTAQILDADWENYSLACQEISGSVKD